MVTLQYNIQDTFWQPALTHTYDLSILLGVDRLSYCICDANKQVLALRSYQMPILQSASVWQTLAGQDAWLGMTFRQTRIGVWHEAFTLLPTVLFDAQRADLYLQSVAPLTNNDRALYHAIGNDMTSVFGIARDWHSALTQQYPNASFTHPAAALLANWLRTASAQDTSVYAFVQHQSLQLAVIQQGKLIFWNRYTFRASSDFVYYVLLIYKQLNLHTHQHTLYMAGELMEESEIYTLLYKYIKNIEFAKRPSALAFGEPFQSLPSHFFIDLFSVNLHV